MDKCFGCGEDGCNSKNTSTSTVDFDRRVIAKQKIENKDERKKEEGKIEDEVEVIGVVEVKVVEAVLEHKTTKGEKKKKSKFCAGIHLAIFSSVCFALTNVIVKCTVGVSRAQLAVFRYFGILLMSIPLVLDIGDNLFGPPSWWFRLWMLLRGLFGGAALLFKFYALEHITMANTTVIVLSTPVFVFLFARLILGETFGRYHLLSLLLSISGIACASKLHLLLIGSDDDNVSDIISNSTTVNNSSTIIFFNSTSSTIFPIMNFTVEDTSTNNSTGNDNSFISNSYSHSLLGNCYALISTILGAMVFVFIRKMSTVHHSIILFNFAWIAIAELLPVVFLSADVSPEELISSLPNKGDQRTPYLLFGLAVLSFYGQVLMTKAIQLEEAGVVAVIRGSSEAVFSFVLEVVIFGVRPDIFSIVGALLVLFSVLLLTVRKYVLSLPEKSNKERGCC